MANSVFFALDINVPSLSMQQESMAVLDEITNQVRIHYQQLHALNSLVKSRFSWEVAA